jgi:hypothetical protein
MTINKRQKEKLRQERQREKEEKRQQRKVDKDRRPAAEGDVDPDIAGIIPGPQPIAEEDQ